jgi:POPLD (NUC188) domain
MGWGPSLLNLLVFAGIRVGGAREMDNYQFECGHGSFPIDYPESLVQDKLAVSKEETEMKKHLTRPKAKRPEFRGLENPFRVRFCDVLGKASGPVGVFHSPHIILILDSLLKTLPKDYDTFKHRLLIDIKKLINGRPNFKSLENLTSNTIDSMFVRVYLTCISGNLKEDSVIHTRLGSEQLDLPVKKEFVIGYTTRANFSLLNRKCTAVGCCLLKGIYDSYKTKSVYIRSRTDRKSRLATFKIIE